MAVEPIGGELISVIVPVYNVEDYLPKCLDSISRQTYNNLEIILVDDGSTDRSGKICDDFAKEDKRAVVVHQENQKQWVARNVGQHIANGQYVMFVDGDDYLDRNALRLLYDALKHNPTYDFAMSDWQSEEFATEKVTSNDENVDYIKLSRDDLMAGLFNGTCLFNPIWNKLYRKSLIENVWARNYTRGQDVDYVLRTFLKANKAIWIRKPLYRYVQRPGSITHRSDYEIIGVKSHVQFLYDNIVDLSKEQIRYRHYMMRDLYRVMTNYIQRTWDSDERQTAVKLCHQYEKTIRWAYWRDNHFRLIEKVAMTMNVRYPYFVRWMKKNTGGKLSWHMISKF